MRAAILLGAFGLDARFGEPPNSFHPVAWFGRVMNALVTRAPRGNPQQEFLYGAGIVTSGVALALAPALLLERVGRNFWLEFFASVWLLKTTFARRALLNAAERVRIELENENLDAARNELRALVSRDTSQLDEPLLAACAIESLAENASDSFVAPLFYYTVFGMRGALVYRALNTLDAMIGYRGRFEYLGKAAARVDDVVNFIPARLTALCLVLVTRSRRAWRVMQNDHARDASPNAGYPMSALAGAMNLRLEKVGTYCFNKTGGLPRAAEIARAAQIVSHALGIALFSSLIVLTLRRK